MKERTLAAISGDTVSPARPRPTLDDVDRRIASILQDHSRTANAEIARRLGMAPSAILERIRKLEEKGVIEGYAARLSPRHLGLGLVAYVLVRAGEGAGVGERLAALPEALEVHHVAGEDGFLLKVRARDAETLGRLVRGPVSAAAGGAPVKTLVALETLKETTSLPLG